MSDDIADLSSGPTTEQVTQQAGVSVAQLHRWTHAGYLIGPRQQGRKNTRGTVAIWPVETVAKARIIAHAAQPKRGADVEIAHALLLNGYDVDSELLRRVLLWYVERWQAWLKPPRRGRPTPDDYDKRKQYIYRASIADVPPTMRPYVERLAVTIARAAYPDPTNTNAITRAAYYLSPAAMRDAITAATPATLEATWKETAALTGYLTAGLPVVTDAFYQALGLPAAAIQAAGQARLQSLGGDSAAHLRLLSTVFYIVATHYRDTLPDAFIEAARSIPQVGTLLTKVEPLFINYLRDTGILARVGEM